MTFLLVQKCALKVCLLLTRGGSVVDVLRLRTLVRTFVGATDDKRYNPLIRRVFKPRSTKNDQHRETTVDRTPIELPDHVDLSGLEPGPLFDLGLGAGNIDDDDEEDDTVPVTEAVHRTRELLAQHAGQCGRIVKRALDVIGEMALGRKVVAADNCTYAGLRQRVCENYFRRVEAKFRLQPGVLEEALMEGVRLHGHSIETWMLKYSSGVELDYKPLDRASREKRARLEEELAVLVPCKRIMAARAKPTADIDAVIADNMCVLADLTN
jgi:hypothetical protein